MPTDLGLYMAAYILTFVLGLPSNSLAFYTFCKKVRQKPTPMDILLLNLSISDLLFILFLPFKMHEVANNMMWDLPFGFCQLYVFIFYMTVYNSTFVLTAISVDRYLGVAFPIQHALKRRPVYAVIASIFFWIVTFINLSFVIILPYVEGGESDNSTNVHSMSTMGGKTNSVCYENFTQAQLNILLPVRLQICVVLFIIPFLICTFSYINFIRILSKLQHIDNRRRMRAIGMALGTLIVFAVCFGPYNLTHIVGYVTGVNPPWRKQALVLSTFNACLDPFIFYMSSSALRGNVGKVMIEVRNRFNRCTTCHMSWGLWRGINNSEKDKEHKQEGINTI